MAFSTIKKDVAAQREADSYSAKLLSAKRSRPEDCEFYLKGILMLTHMFAHTTLSPGSRSLLASPKRRQLPASHCRKACLVGRADLGVVRDVSAQSSLPRRTEEQSCAMDDDRDDRSCSCQEGVLFIYPSTPNPNSHVCLAFIVRWSSFSCSRCSASATGCRATSNK